MTDDIACQSSFITIIKLLLIVIMFSFKAPRNLSSLVLETIDMFVCFSGVIPTKICTPSFFFMMTRLKNNETDCVCVFFAFVFLDAYSNRILALDWREGKGALLVEYLELPNFDVALDTTQNFMVNTSSGSLVIFFCVSFF